MFHVRIYLGKNRFICRLFTNYCSRVLHLEYGMRLWVLPRVMHSEAHTVRNVSFFFTFSVFVIISRNSLAFISHLLVSSFTKREQASA
jgi:hypothetical protein